MRMVVEGGKLNDTGYGGEEGREEGMGWCKGEGMVRVQCQRGGMMLKVLRGSKGQTGGTEGRGRREGGEGKEGPDGEGTNLSNIGIRVGVGIQKN